MHSLSAQHCQPHCANPKMARTWSHMSSAALGPGTFGTPSKPEISKTFETVRTHENPELQNLRNRSHFPNRNLSEPIETWNHLRNPGTWRNLEPPSEPRNLSEPIETWNHLQYPEPVGTSKPRTPSEPGTCRNPSNGTTFGSRNPFPEPPQLAQNTPKSILCKDPIAFCCWGNMLVRLDHFPNESEWT